MSPATPSILIVDDQPENLKLLAELLTPRGYQPRPVPSGPLALQAAACAPPDLVLLDISMPGMDGFEVCRRMKADPRLAAIPVLFVSAHGGTDDKVQAFRCGGVDYIPKPFHAEEVLARVDAHLGLARLRRELEEANARLAEANQELDLFAHTAAHDLRSPLHHLTSFLDLLAAQLGSPDAKTRTYLDRLFAATQRMDRLITDLLAYSASARAALRSRPTELDPLVREVLEQLEPELRGRRIRWELQPLPRVMGDPVLLRLVLQNLLHNAAKFTRHVEEAVIEVRPLADGTGFQVQDNGAGFETGKAAELFLPFKRFHRQEEFEGTGLGLAHVQRIVARHGGRVWADGAPGRGATIRVALPGVSEPAVAAR